MSIFRFRERHDRTIGWLSEAGWTGQPRSSVAQIEAEVEKLGAARTVVMPITIGFVSELDGIVLKSDITDIYGMSDLEISVRSALVPTGDERRTLEELWGEPISPLCSYVDASCTLWVGVSGKCRFAYGVDEWWFAGDCIEDALEWYRVGMLPEQWEATRNVI
jgi:hypothetical protein